MPEDDLDQLLWGAVEAVLETMFFAAPLGPAEPETGPGVLRARLAFHGAPSGTLAVGLSAASARLLAAGFLGEDEEALTASQPGEVVCELANMLCGSFVSGLEGEEKFELASPALCADGAETAEAETSPAVRQSYQLENGILTVTVHLEAVT